MKKMVGGILVVALAAGTWMPMAQADTRSDLKQASDIAQLLQSGVLDPLLNPLYTSKPAFRTVVNLGTRSIITANTLANTVDTFQGKTKKAIADLQAAAKAVNNASMAIKNAKTTQEQIDTLLVYLDAQGKFIDVIATYMASLNSDIVAPVFTLVEAMPYVGDKMVIFDKDKPNAPGKPVSTVVGGMLNALKGRNDTYIKAVDALPSVIKAVEASAAAGTTATVAPAVKAEDLGF